MNFIVFKNSIIAALVLGAVSTLGDFVWEMWIPSHKTIWGVVHGAILCLCLGLVLGWFAKIQGAILRGGLGELFVGLISAGSFYALFPLVGMSAMFISWMFLWILTSLMNRWIKQDNELLKTALVKGGAAAILSGLAFYGISGIWLAPPLDGPNYVVNFLSWTIAFLPGFLALYVNFHKEG